MLYIQLLLAVCTKLASNWNLVGVYDDKVVYCWCFSNKPWPDIRDMVYCSGVQAGGIEEWEFTLRQFKSEEHPTDKGRLRKALLCTDQSWLLYRWRRESIQLNKLCTLNYHDWKTKYVLLGGVISNMKFNSFSRLKIYKQGHWTPTAHNN